MSGGGHRRARWPWWWRRAAAVLGVLVVCGAGYVLLGGHDVRQSVRRVADAMQVGPDAAWGSDDVSPGVLPTVLPTPAVSAHNGATVGTTGTTTTGATAGSTSNSSDLPSTTSGGSPGGAAGSDGPGSSGGTGGSGSSGGGADSSTCPCRPTTTTLQADPVSGPAYQSVTLNVQVTATTGTPGGVVELYDGATLIGRVTLDGTGYARAVFGSFGPGEHHLRAWYTGTSGFGCSASADVVADYDGIVTAGATDVQTVDVVVPVGAITVSTPYTAAHPLHLGSALLDPATSTYSASAQFGDADDPTTAIKVTDTRAGSTGWTLTVVASDLIGPADAISASAVGLTGVRAVQVVGNALVAADVQVLDHPAGGSGLAVPCVLATYRSDTATLGTAQLDAQLELAGIPTSVHPGVYTATLVFTAS